MENAKEYLKRTGIDNRVINREDLPEYWKRPSDLMEEYHQEQVKNSVVLADVSQQSELLVCDCTNTCDELTEAGKEFLKCKGLPL